MVIRNSTDTSLSIIAVDHPVTNCSKVPLNRVSGCQMYIVCPGGVGVCTGMRMLIFTALEKPKAFPRIQQWNWTSETVIGVLWLFKMASIFTTQ